MGLENIHHLQEDFYKCSMGNNDKIVDSLGRFKVITSKFCDPGNFSFDKSAIIEKVLCNVPQN